MCAAFNACSCSTTRNIEVSRSLSWGSTRSRQAWWLSRHLLLGSGRKGVLPALRVFQERARRPDAVSGAVARSAGSGGVQVKEEPFRELMASVREAGRIRRGTMKASRVTVFRPTDVKAVRRKLGASQSEFALMIGVSVATLRNWEQGRRTPEGPAVGLAPRRCQEPGGGRRGVAQQTRSGLIKQRAGISGPGAHVGESKKDQSVQGSPVTQTREARK